MSLRQTLKDLRDAADDLLLIPDLTVAPLDAWKGVDPSPLLNLRKQVRPSPKWTTRSDSRLFTYYGAALGLRQGILLTSFQQQEALPPGFANAPGKLLCTVGQLLANYPVPSVPLEPKPLTEKAKTLIDAWETCGLGIHATCLFYLSHMFLPAYGEWAPLTFDQEG